MSHENQLCSIQTVKDVQGKTDIATSRHTTPAVTAIKNGSNSQSVTFGNAARDIIDGDWDKMKSFDSSGDILKNPSDRKVPPRNILGGEWDRMESFDSSGGVWRKGESSVELIVPKDVVSDANIYGKVFTNVGPLYTLFKLNEKERFVSPVVEFIDYNHTEFDRHLEVKIPCDDDSLSKQDFRVLYISGRGQVKSVPLTIVDTPEEDKPDVYYEVRHGDVHVFTKHFSVFSCVSCNTDAVTIEAFLFLSRIQYDYPANCHCKVHIRLCVFGGQYSIEEFNKRHDHNADMCGLKVWDRKPILVKRWNRCHQICASILLADNGQHWKPMLRTDGNPVFDNEPLEICMIEGLQSETVLGEWMISNTTNVEGPFECVVDIHVKDRNDQYIHKLDTLHVRKDCAGSRLTRYTGCPMQS